jgi:hypothetical protein
VASIPVAVDFLLVVEVADHVVAIFGDVAPTGLRAQVPGERSASRRASPGRSRVFDGMHAQ